MVLVLPIIKWNRTNPCNEFQHANEKGDSYIWQDGTKSLIPEDFKFPHCMLLGAWRIKNNKNATEDIFKMAMLYEIH